MPGTTSISPFLMAQVREAFILGVRALASRTRRRADTNGFSERTLSAYILAMAAIEAFVNEVYFAEPHRRMLHDAPMWQLRADWLEKLDLREKILLLSHLVYERPFSRGAQPFQRLDTLVRIRNDLVHYKMEFREPKFLAELRREGIPLPPVPSPPGLEPVEGPWAQEVATTEGARWANNVAVEIVDALVALTPDSESAFRERRLDRFGTYSQYTFIGEMARMLASNFVPITTEDRDRAFAALEVS